MQKVAGLPWWDPDPSLCFSPIYPSSSISFTKMVVTPTLDSPLILTLLSPSDS